MIRNICITKYKQIYLLLLYFKILFTNFTKASKSLLRSHFFKDKQIENGEILTFILCFSIEVRFTSKEISHQNVQHSQ